MEQTGQKGRSASHWVHVPVWREGGRGGHSMAQVTLSRGCPPTKTTQEKRIESGIRGPESVPCPSSRKLCGLRQVTLALRVFAFFTCKSKKSLIFLLTESWCIYSMKPQNKTNPLLGVLSQITTLLMNWSPFPCSFKIRVARISYGAMEKLRLGTSVQGSCVSGIM